MAREAAFYATHGRVTSVVEEESIRKDKESLLL